MSTNSPVFVTLNETGAALARKLAGDVPGSEVHGLKTRVAQADIPFSDTLAHLRGLFSDGRTIIAIASAGIVIRALAPLLADKTEEPPVLALSEDGSSVVPLLGGHQGANELARMLAEALGINPAITTAGDTRFGIALDNPPQGWRIANRDKAKPVMAAMLNGDAVNIKDETAVGVNKSWLMDAELSIADDAESAIRLSHARLPEDTAEVLLSPAVLALGIGCERGVALDDMATFIFDVFKENDIGKHAIACVATIDLKEDETAIKELAKLGDVPVRLFDAATLDQETPRVTDPSDYVFETVGTHSVSEAAALAAAGPNAELIVPKQKRGGMTCAVALSPTIIEPEKIGRSCGRLAVIGIGPGSNEWRAPEATNEISQATDIVGYKLYLDLLGPLIDGKTRHDYPLGEERDRVAAALNLAAEGKQVALVSSGDIGIYAMACLVFELIEQGPMGEVNKAWQRIETHVVPGISALQAAAAKIGAPLGHDFCTVSLSNLLTPWEVIEQRLKAAADGDFVVALYNPVSMKRREQLGLARDILLTGRPAETPVVLARNLGRDEEKVDVITLGELDAELVDMLTVVLIGSSETRAFKNGDGSMSVYTPRGYGDKKESF
ncbi:MAG: precorrin-3B C(17)-methyltransferase [Rhodospirillaceae bacterium]|jgi:cobalt-precorrin 5A hydrolase / precorrin-3B C17-methyltransferase|nr:precorrin-3B C(17)-methyltransferase [Rhodospirillaceae bacterium]MBT4588254.1 precorrin-3B C(17)-methyltransferase [Rhodospirillaceae bacterium]MBT5941222.1 precorrin-3B C(17)-methyltransferase [Rhodospirillaceae bacterium]MBT7265240.1 precorrin-3B C(17)-methyltransferase [Rhodospirillaceae bacterium]